jgi:DNA-binding SARP family transcriptional activator
VECAILGQTEIRADGIRLTPDAERQFGLALYFCANAGREIARDDVAELLWPEQGAEAARHCLRQGLYRLRAVGMPVRTGVKSIVLDEALVDTDYRPVVADGAAVDAFLALNDVTVLPGYAPRFAPAFARWVEEFRDDIGARLRRGLVRSIVDARARGRYGDAERLARHCLTLDPLNEEATFALAEATALAGGKAEALRMIERYEREIGTHPELSVPTRILKSRVSDLAAELGIGRVRRVPLVGRESELEWLLTVLSDVSRGLSRSVCLVGDGGIGKTALVEEFLRMASLRNASCVRVRCQASDAERPLSAICEIVGQLIGMRGALGASPASLEAIRPLLSYKMREEDAPGESASTALSRKQLHDGVADILDAVSDEAPLIVFIDDAHCVDYESLRLITELNRHQTGRPFCLVSCSRTLRGQDEVRFRSDDSAVQLREIRALDREASRQLVLAHVEAAAFSVSEDVIADLLRLAGGNPLFLVELARRVTERPYESLPSNLASLLDARIASRSALALTVLQACSVLGKHATIARLEQLLELRVYQLAAALNELEAHALITGNEERIECRHDLIAAAALRTIEPAASTLLRKRAARKLEEDAFPSGDPALLWQSAQFWEATFQFGEARRVLEVLGNYLLTIGSANESSEAFERALGYCNTDDERMQLLGKRLIADRAACRWPDVLSSLERRSAIRLAHGGIYDGAEQDTFLHYEAVWHIGRDLAGGDLLSRLLELIKSSDGSPTARLAAVQRALILSINALDKQAASLVASGLTTYASIASLSTETLATLLIYHSDFGDLSLGVEIAELIHDRLPITTSIGPSDLQKLRWSAVPLTYVGRFDDAHRLLVKIYEAASVRKLWMEAVDACEALCLLNVLRSDTSTAREWRLCLQGWCAQANDQLCQAACDYSGAMIEFVEGAFDEAYQLACSASNALIVRKSSFAKARVQCVGLKVAIEISRNEEPSNADVEELSELLERSLDLGCLDVSVFALASVFRRSGRKNEYRSLCERYQKKRRERYPLPVFLARKDFTAANAPVATENVHESAKR